MPQHRLSPPLITLTTDFGLSDTYVSVMKGVMLSIAPLARLVDITHQIAPQNSREASIKLESAVPFFPPGTVHLVVVDPGVGSMRKNCVVETKRAFYVAPDNGVLTLPLRLDPPVRAVHFTDNCTPYALQTVSATFHGRDLFAPIAAHIASGLDMEQLGDMWIADSESQCPLISLDFPEPALSADGSLLCSILYIDHFGNIITNLGSNMLKNWMANTLPCSIAIQSKEVKWKGISRTFADVAPGEPLAYVGSSGRLELAVRDGNAAAQLGASLDSSFLLKKEHSSQNLVSH